MRRTSKITFVFVFAALVISPRIADAQLAQQDQSSTHMRALFPQGEFVSTYLETRIQSDLRYDVETKPKEKSKFIKESQVEFWKAKAGGQPASASQTQSMSASQSRPKFEVSPHIGYNTAGGYTVDFEEAFDIEWDPEDDDGGDIASSRGGFVVGVGGSVALSEQKSFNLRLRPSIGVTLISDQSESVDESFTLGASQQYLQVSGDVVASFNRGDSFTPYAGGGLTYVSFSGELTVDDLPDGTTEEEFFDLIDAEDFDAEEGEVNESSIGLSLVGGVRLNEAVDFGVPYAQLRLALVDPRTDTLTDLDAPSLSPAITLAGGVSLGL
jgi:opacity protein-like surface antigen